MSESKARAVVRARSGGFCEICGAQATSWSHRVAKGQGGLWEASNGVALCGDGIRGCHGWLHANPTKARAGGWIVPSWGNPLEVPVWLARPWMGWFLLDDHGFLTAVDPEDHGLPAVPDLPQRKAAA